MVPINLAFLSENINFNIKVSGSLCVLRYYTIHRRGRSNTIKRGKTVSFLIFINLEKRIRIKKGCKYNKLKFTNPTQKGKFWSYCVCVSFWRHGRVVRRGTANPFSPVQIRVPPHQQTNRNLLFYSAIFWCSGDFVKDWKSLNLKFKERL